MTQPLKVFLTGACTVSCHLIVKLLRATPHRVVVLVNEQGPHRTEQFLKLLHERQRLTATEGARLEVVHGDVRRDGLKININKLQELAGSLDVIVHTASEKSVSSSKSNYDNLNRIGTANALVFAGHCFSRGPLKRFVHLSSAFVAGTKLSGPASENELQANTAHLNNLERSKYEAERLVRAAMHAGLPVTIFRPSIAVGEPLGPAQIVPNAVEAILKTAYGGAAVLRLPIDPQSRVHFAPVKFIVEAILRAINADWTAGLTFHLTAESPPCAAQVFHYRQMIRDGMKSPLLYAPEDFDLLSCSLREREMLESCRCYVPYFSSRFAFETVNAKRLIELPRGSLEYPMMWDSLDIGSAVTPVAA